jgi:hypothetical protein
MHRSPANGFIFWSERASLTLAGAVRCCSWATGYAVLPQLGVYEPIWKYDLKTLEKDLSAHLVFGTATAAAFSFLTHLEVDQ